MAILGTSASDTLSGTFGDDTILGFEGNDTIFGSDGVDTIDGGTGADRVNFYLYRGDLFSATSGPRSFTLTSGALSEAGGPIQSTLTSVERVYFSSVGTGDFGGNFDARGFAPSANSLFVGFFGSGNDVIYGSPNRDVIDAGEGTNWIDAGGGIDDVRVRFANGSDTAFVTMANGAVITTVGGLVTNTVLNAEYVGIVGSDPNAATTRVDASGLVGYDGQLIFWDHNGSNISIGSPGRDIFANVDGATAGQDVYTGNGGADTYDYTYAVSAMNGDVINDFDADDIIDLQYNSPATNAGGMLAYLFIGNGAFTGVAGQYRYECSGGKTYVQVDTNGDGSADKVLTIANGQFALAETAPGSNILVMTGISGTSGADVLRGTSGNDRLFGQGGNDQFYASTGVDVIDGGAGGADRLFVVVGGATGLPAPTGPRTYTITSGSIRDSSGQLDTQFSGVERVVLDLKATGGFSDTIDARSFSSPHGTPLDIVLGGGNYTVWGSNQNDRIWSGIAANTIDAGSGYDIGFAMINASASPTVLLSSVGGSFVTTVNGVTSTYANFEEMQVRMVGEGTVTIDASGWTPIAGQALYLVGHSGTDIMIGSSGSDFFGNVTGTEHGHDVYNGNGGADIYDYTWAADSMNGDTIVDFDIDDVIDFRFNNLEAGGSPVLCNRFIGDGAFSGTAGEYRYQIDGTRTVVEVDGNGDGLADLTLNIANGAFRLAETSPGSNMLTLASVIQQVEGVVADGYLAGATLFLDVNGNGVRDAGEAWTTTDANGDYVLNVNQLGTLVATGGTNIDTGLANTMTLAAPVGSSVVNPLTTLVQAVVAAGGGATSAAAAEAQVKQALGLDASLSLLGTDLIAAAATSPAALDAQKAAAIVANLVTTVVAAPGGGTSGGSAVVAALATMVATGSTTIDLTSTATLTSLVTTAAPSSDVAGIVAEASVEGSAIAAATSLELISKAQVDASSFDTVVGTSGNDRIDGSAGRDRIVGGDGFDLLRGGDGDDVFVPEVGGATQNSKAGAISLDTIVDFSPGHDVIDLSGLDANSGLGGVQDFRLIGQRDNKQAGDLSFKVYGNVQAAESALGLDIDGIDGKSPYAGPVTIVFGNVDGGTPDFAIALIGVSGVTESNFLF